MDMFTDKPAPTRNNLSSVNLKRNFGGEDWTRYNRISFWIRPLVSGFADTVTVTITLPWPVCGVT